MKLQEYWQSTTSILSLKFEMGVSLLEVNRLLKLKQTFTDNTNSKCLVRYHRTFHTQYLSPDIFRCDDYCVNMILFWHVHDHNQ